MCLCTHYDSHCGHSWMSMTTPCGYLRDFLNCLERQIVQFCIAPPATCPQCFAGFANPEIIEMIQGPWGCNQMIRSHLGGPHVIPGHWGKVNLPQQHWKNGQLMPGDWGGQPRLMGPTPPGSNVTAGSRGWRYDDFAYRGDVCFRRGWKKQQEKDVFHYRKYKHKVKDGAGCVIM